MAKKATKKQADGVKEGELLDPIGDALAADEDEQVAATAGAAVVRFLKELAGFFTTARVLEQNALITRDQALRLATPKSAEEDEQIQRFIRKANADKKEVETHWQITTTISGFHRRMTARRAKSTDALDQAARHANGIHNAYVEAEKRRAAAEQRRIEEEAEARARQQRDAELAELDRQAVAREEATKELSGREQVFVEQMAKYGDGVRAAREAGFPDAVKSSARLLKLEKIRAAVLAHQEAAALRRQQAAVAREPLDIGPTRTVAPNITKAPGAIERTYHYGDLVDEEALVKAILAGSYGIPTDLLRIDPSKLNQYAKDLQDRINRWPGVKYRKETKVV